MLFGSSDLTGTRPIGPDIDQLLGGEFLRDRTRGFGREPDPVRGGPTEAARAEQRVKYLPGSRGHAEAMPVVGFDVHTIHPLFGSISRPLAGRSYSASIGQ